MLPKRCPETSVNNYHKTPRNIPEELRYQRLNVVLTFNYYIIINSFGPKIWPLQPSISNTVTGHHNKSDVRPLRFFVARYRVKFTL